MIFYLIEFYSFESKVSWSIRTRFWNLDTVLCKDDFRIFASSSLDINGIFPYCYLKRRRRNNGRQRRIHADTECSSWHSSCSTIFRYIRSWNWYVSRTVKSWKDRVITLVMIHLSCHGNLLSASTILNYCYFGRNRKILRGINNDLYRTGSSGWRISPYFKCWRCVINRKQIWNRFTDISSTIKRIPNNAIKSSLQKIFKWPIVMTRSNKIFRYTCLQTRRNKTSVNISYFVWIK